MYFFFDESGDLDLTPEAPPSVIAAVMVPDSLLAESLGNSAAAARHRGAAVQARETAEVDRLAAIEHRQRD
jgi:hypothetical protein